MRVSSPMFEEAAEIPTQYTCDGEDVNPPFIFLDVPEDAQSLVFIVDDPDAPGKVWTHWVLFNISPDTNEIQEDSVPSGAVQGMNDFGNDEYGGPCPPQGETHTYHFNLYALDSHLDLKEGSSKEEVQEAMNGHTIGSAELTGTYHRT